MKKLILLTTVVLMAMTFMSGCGSDHDTYKQMGGPCGAWDDDPQVRKAYADACRAQMSAVANPTPYNSLPGNSLCDWGIGTVDDDGTTITVENCKERDR